MVVDRSAIETFTVCCGDQLSACVLGNDFTLFGKLAGVCNGQNSQRAKRFDRGAINDHQ